MLFINTEVFLFITDISFVTNGEKNSPRVSGEILRLLLAVMGTQGNNSNIDFSIVNLVNHAILFVDTTRPCFFKDIVLQVLYLTSACTGMLLKFQKHICDFLDGGFVATLFDGGNLFLGLFRKQYSVSHFLQRID